MRRCGRRFIADEQGHLLLEAVISQGIYALLLPVVTAGLFAVTHQWTRTVEQLETRQQAHMLLQRLQTEVRVGRQFVALTDGVAFLDPQDRLIRYQRAATGLVLRDEQGVGTSVVGSGVTHLQATPDSFGRALTVTFTTRQTATAPPYTIHAYWYGRGHERSPLP